MALFTADQITAKLIKIRAARDGGVLIIGHGADRVQFQSFEAMDKIIASLQAELDGLNGVTARPRLNYIEQTSKGFGRGGCDGEF